MKIKLTTLLLIMSLVSFSQNKKIENFKITILSTMLSDIHVGEWGFSAMIEADGKKILFDAGSRENTVLQNARELNISLENIKDVFISHNHKDHTGGLLKIKENYPNSFTDAHVGQGIFYSRPNENGSEHYILKNKNKLDKLGVKFIRHYKPAEIMPGI